MASRFTGQRRSLVIIIQKYENNVLISTIRKDGKERFDWQGETFPEITNNYLANMSYDEFIHRLNNYIGYLQSIYPFFEKDIQNLPIENNYDSCPVDITATFEIHDLESFGAEGFISDGTTTSDTLISKIGVGNSTITMTAIEVDGSIFIGWSTSTSIDDVFSENLTYTHTFTTNQTFYAIFAKLRLKSDYVSKEFCFYENGTYTDDFELSCDNVVTVYFKEDEYNENGIEGSVWYSDTEFTNTVNDGLYKENNDDEAAPVYQLEDGIPTLYTITKSESFSCVPDASPIVSLTPQATVSITPTLTPSPTFGLTPSPTPTITATISTTPSITPTISVTISLTPTPSKTPQATPTLTPTSDTSPTPTPTKSVTPTISTTPSVTPSNGATLTPTPTPTPSSEILTISQSTNNIFFYSPCSGITIPYYALSFDPADVLSELANFDYSGKELEYIEFIDVNYNGYDYLEHNGNVINGGDKIYTINNGADFYGGNFYVTITSLPYRQREIDVRVRLKMKDNPNLTNDDSIYYTIHECSE